MHAIHAELAVAKPEALPSGYQELAGLVAVTLLLRQASGHDEAPTWTGEGWRAAGFPDLVIAKLEGHDARSRGADAHDAVAAACAARGSVSAGVLSNGDAEPSIVPRMLSAT